MKREVEVADLSVADKKALLELTRQTLVYYIKEQKSPSPKELEIEITEPMKKVMGAFVTLHKAGQLRGCIGEIEPRRPLFEAVMDQAINAGLHDYRFKPVTAQELEQIDFEISALTPPQAISAYQEIKIGEHGVILRKAGRSAVFLPQVAPQQGWDVEQTLTHLSRKAGLPSDAWREGASFEVFEAIVFAEQAA